MTHPSASVTPVELQQAIRNVADFPQPGVQFKDISLEELP